LARGIGFSQSETEGLIDDARRRNGAWAADEAIEQLQRLARFNLQAIEQPRRAA
jgi:hypothetical protein